MVELEAVEVEESPDERMDWEPETVIEKGNEAYPFILGGVGDGFLHHDIIDGLEPGAREGDLHWRQVPDGREPVKLTMRRH